MVLYCEFLPLILFTWGVRFLAQLSRIKSRFVQIQLQRNESAAYDGVFNVFTGVDDIGKMGFLDMWNKTRQTEYYFFLLQYFPDSASCSPFLFSFYKSDCGKVNGSFGEAWPPYRERTSISLYSTDLCRSFPTRQENLDFNYCVLTYWNESIVHNTKSIRSQVSHSRLFGGHQ